MKIMKSFAAFTIASLLLFSVAGCSVQLGNSASEKEQKVEGTQQNGTNTDISSRNGEKNQTKDNGEKTAAKTTSSSPESTGSTVYISASQLNVRQSPSKNGNKIDTLKKGSAVQIIDTKTDENKTVWNKILYGNTTGWIAAQYTVKDPSGLLSDSLKQLDFSPQPKVTKDYPGNPRVKVKGIYLTIYAASSQKLDKLIALAKETDINTFVIDVKDDRGSMLFHTQAAEKYAPAANKAATVKDIGALMKKLKDNNIHTIARIVSFKDPTYTTAHPDRSIIDKRTGKPFTNSDHLAWATAYDHQLWQYNIAVAKEAAKAGFNEIQFDYVRFPASNGGKLDKELDYRNTKNESKPKAIQEYLQYAYEELSPLKVYISADIYGLVGSVSDDMALGQYWEAVSNVVDYISPMMYPSHYGNGTYKLSIPDAYPYETVFHSAKDSINRNKNIKTPAVIRPWIQDFTASWVPGHISYGEKEVRAQIKALEDNGIDEYLLWNASNAYTESALK